MLYGDLMTVHILLTENYIYVYYLSFTVLCVLSTIVHQQLPTPQSCQLITTVFTHFVDDQ